MLGKFVAAIATFFGVMTGLDWLWNAMNIQSPPQVWAMTTTTVFLIIFLAINYCTYRQQSLRQRLEECAFAKSRLEQTLLKKRLSSKR
jgi:hypothetical protein